MHNRATQYFDIQQIAPNIYWIKPRTIAPLSIDRLFDKLKQFMELTTELITNRETQGIVYSPPIEDVDYTELYKVAEDNSDFYSKLSELVLSSTIFQSAKKPIIGFLDKSCQNTVLSIMLWATYRIAFEDIEIGFAEPNYGIFPGFGGTIVTARLLGPEIAIPLLTQGVKYSAQEGYQHGIINQLIPRSQDPVITIVDCIENYAEISKDQIALRGQRSLEIDEDQLEQASAFISKRTNMLNLGINACIDVVKRSLGLPIKDALLLEAELFSKAWTTPQALSMLRSRYIGINQAVTLHRPKTPLTINKIGVIGAGMMGAGIAFQAAKSGITTILCDINLNAAQQGKQYAHKITNKQVQLNQITLQQQKEILERIYPTASYDQLDGSELIIEAIFEDKNLKAEITNENEGYLNPAGIFATNTTSIPISILSKAMQRPECYLGMHFFSPVDKMQLVEIIRGEDTNEETIIKAVQIAYQLNKIPIVVNDGPAFFTSRIFFNYILEAITMLLEGIPGMQIEKASREAGFAVGPLAVLDEISLDLMMHVYNQMPAMHSSQQRCYSYLEKLTSLGRNGKKSGCGLYDYDATTSAKTIWIDPDLPSSNNTYPNDQVKNRLLNVMALDSFRCLNEGILTKAIDGDIGSILGVGYPPQTGGVFSYIDQIGIQRFVAQCNAFQNSGDQWNIPSVLSDLASKNFTFYNKFIPNVPFDRSN